MLAHWDEVEGKARVVGHLGGTWTNLGRAAGTVGAGLQRIQLPPGRWSTPAHVHGRNEEIFFVLGGSGLSWQDGETHEVRAGDCLVHRVAGRAHTLLAGDDGLDVLVFGTRKWDEAPTLPRAQAAWLGEGWVVLGGEEDHPWKREAAAGPPELPAEPSPRPPSIVNVDEVEPDGDDDVPPAYESEWRDLGRAAGSELTGVSHIRLQPGRVSAQHHCHSAEEEIFVMLEGDGTLELVPSPRLGAPDEHVPVRAGHVVSRPPATRVAHAFRAGEGGLTLLAYGTREPNDIAYYPRSRKLNFRGVGVIVRAEHVDYWDGA